MSQIPALNSSNAYTPVTKPPTSSPTPPALTQSEAPLPRPVQIDLTEDLQLQTQKPSQPATPSVDFLGDPPQPTLVTLPQSPQAEPSSGPSLDAIRKGKGVLKPGESSPEVPKLLEMLGKVGYKVQHEGQQLDGEVLRALKKFQADYGVASDKSPYSGQLGKTTLKTLEQALKGPRINLKHPLLRRLNREHLNTGNDSTCVKTVLYNLDRLGVKTFQGGTTADPNNARGAMVQMQQAGHWQSAPLAGSKPKTIHSPYGTIQAHVLSAKAYDRLVHQNQIPNGCVIFQTNHGWDYSGGAHGNDMGIVQNGKIHNYANMGGMYVYPGSLKEVVVMVPRDAIRS